MTPPSPLRLAVLFGGPSAEHEISLRSAREVLAHLDSARYLPLLVGITREGGWLGPEASHCMLEGEDVEERGGAPFLPDDCACVFPILHGPGGEDGKIQGWLEILGVPCVGSGSVGSALAMDKILAKIVLRHAGLPVLAWTEVDARELEGDVAPLLEKIAADRGFPCFVKPTCQGSSIGITRVEDADGLLAALEEAFRHGPRALVERAVQDPREFEIAILDGSEPLVSDLGEIRLEDDSWYDYEEKYESSRAKLVLGPSGLPEALVSSMKEQALAAFRALELSGMARVDFLFASSAGRFWLNEVNTIPGFTSISMYPRLMADSGVDFTRLLDRLITLALGTREKAPGEAAPLHWVTS